MYCLCRNSTPRNEISVEQQVNQYYPYWSTDSHPQCTNHNPDNKCRQNWKSHPPIIFLPWQSCVELTRRINKDQTSARFENIHLKWLKWNNILKSSGPKYHHNGPRENFYQSNNLRKANYSSKMVYDYVIFCETKTPLF